MPSAATLLTKSVFTLLSLMLPAFAAAAAPPPSPGERIAIPGARSIDHAGFTVPDLEQGITFFTDIFGAAVLWRSAPFTADRRGPLAPSGLNADPRAACLLAMLRLGPNLNVELLEYSIPGTTQAMPLASGLNVGHFAFDVEDIQAAGAYLRGKKVDLLEGPRHNTSGPNRGQDSWFFRTPWGMTIELVQRPPGMPYEKDSPGRLFKAPASAGVVEKQILQLENERVEAMLQRDQATLARLMAPDCVHIESTGKVRSTAEFLADFEQADFAFETFVIDENQARVIGDTAVVTGRYHNVLRTKGKLQPEKKARHTRVWARQPDDRWVLISHQATEIAEAR